MKHKESDLQIQCVRWFRYQYPEYARLLEHPHNEGNAFNSRQQAIANAEGVTKGVADLILHVPAHIAREAVYSSLAIEMKTKTGRQSPEQKIWQRYFEAAGGLYTIVRSFEEFTKEVGDYMAFVPVGVGNNVKRVHAEITKEADDAAIKKFKSIVSPKR